MSALATSDWILLAAILNVAANLPAFWALRRAGLNGWWVLVAALPLAGLLFLWAFAFDRWPFDPAGRWAYSPAWRLPRFGRSRALPTLSLAEIGAFPRP